MAATPLPNLCSSSGTDLTSRPDLPRLPPPFLQTEKAFQKQEGVTGCFKSKDKKAPGKSGHRFFKNVGLNFKTPKEAIDGV